MIRASAVTTLLLFSSSQAGAQESDKAATPMVVTSDTGAYCIMLGQQISASGAHGGLPQEVRDLQAQGRELCATGHVRGGINRLRRALMVLRDQRSGGAGAQEIGDPPRVAEALPRG